MDEPDFRAALQQLADAVDGWGMKPTADDPLAIAMDHAREVLFPRLARLMQEPTVFELGELPPPDAAQAEGPSLDDVAELCKEFGFVPGNNGALLAFHDMITAAITRWPAPAAQPAAWPVNLAELHDPDFSGGLTPSQHLDVLHGGPDPRAAATPPALPPDYIDPEHQGEDRELLEVFYRAGRAEGSTGNEFALRGIRAVLAHRPTPPRRPRGYIDPEYEGEDRELLEMFYRAGLAEGDTTNEILLHGIRAVLAHRPSVAAVRAADAAISDEALEAQFRAWWKAHVHPLTVPAYHAVTTHVAWARHILSRRQP